MPNRRHILIIDDDHDLRVLLRHVLEQMDFSVRTVTNGKDALENLSKYPKLPELIILDLQMPIMNGNEFLSLKNNNERLKNIPVLIVSSQVEECIENAMVEKIHKPLNLDEFISKIHECLNR
jgi:CheY-like chemotaxis protein